MLVDIKFKGLDLEVIGTYYKATRFVLDEVPQPESFEIESVFYKGNDVWDIICALNGEEEVQNLTLNQL